MRKPKSNSNWGCGEVQYEFTYPMEVRGDVVVCGCKAEALIALDKGTGGDWYVSGITVTALDPEGVEVELAHTDPLFKDMSTWLRMAHQRQISEEWERFMAVRRDERVELPV